MTMHTPATAGGFEARPPQNGNRSPDDIEADIERTRERLAGTVNEIADRVKPANVVRRKTEGVRQLAAQGIDTARAQVVDPNGNVRTERVAALGVAAIAAVGLMVWRGVRRR